MTEKQRIKQFIADRSLETLWQPSQVARYMVWGSFVFIIVAVLWAHFAKLDEVTIGDGRVIPSRQMQVIQNLEGGIVKAVYVAEGDVVEAGQVLMDIDDTQAKSAYQDGRYKYEGLLLQETRLKAEIANRPFVIPERLLNSDAEMIESEEALYEARQHELATKLNILKQQVDQKQYVLQETFVKQEQLQQDLKIIDKELAMVNELLPDGLVPKTKLYELEREQNDKQSQLRASQHAVPRLKSAIAEAENKIIELQQSFRTEAINELNTVEEEIERSQQTNLAMHDRVKRTAVRSSVKGIINKIHVGTIGGVVKPGEDLMEIVPLDDSLLIEAKIRPSDIAFLRPGQTAMVRFSAYDYAIFGGLKADLEHISADTITDERGDTYYLIRVRTQKSHLGNQQGELPIIPGMTASVDILTGKKSVLNYLLKPVLKAKYTALRER